MTNSKWAKLSQDMRSAEYAYSVVDAIELGSLNTVEAKLMLWAETNIYGLVLTNLENDIKSLFQHYSGAAFPDSQLDGLDKVAFEAIIDVLQDKQTYGPSFNTCLYKTDMMIVTEKAIKALGIEPSTLPEIGINDLPAQNSNNDANADHTGPLPQLDV